MGFNNWANVRKFCHGHALGTPNPCPPDGIDLEKDPSAKASSGETGSPTAASTNASGEGSNPSTSTPQPDKVPKKSSRELASISIEDLAASSAKIA